MSYTLRVNANVDYEDSRHSDLVADKYLNPNQTAPPYPGKMVSMGCLAEMV